MIRDFRPFVYERCSTLSVSPFARRHETLFYIAVWFTQYCVGLLCGHVTCCVVMRCVVCSCVVCSNHVVCVLMSCCPTGRSRLSQDTNTGRSWPHAGHGFWARDTQDCGAVWHAPEEPATDSHVLGNVSRADPAIGRCVCRSVKKTCTNLVQNTLAKISNTCSGRHSQYSFELIALVPGVALHNLKTCLHVEHRCPGSASYIRPYVWEQ